MRLAASSLPFPRPLLLVVGVAIGMAACTSSKDIRKTQQQIRSVNDYRQVNSQVLREPLNEYRKEEEDEVLYHLETGMLSHFEGEWRESSTHLQQAERAIEENYTKSINRNVQAMLVNDLQLAYDGEAYEDVYINVVKALNYLHQDQLEEALVEARRVAHKLERINDRYKGLAKSLAKRDTAQAALKKVDEQLEDVSLLTEEEQAPEITQNSALGRFLTAVLYAKQGSTDDARIELQKLRTALEDQGGAEFLTALAREADGQGETARPAPKQKARTDLLVRATPREGASPSPLQVYVNDRRVATVSRDSMRGTDGRRSARLKNVPVARGDTVSFQAGTASGPLQLEVWSDSLQYRGALAGAGDASFVLGQPEVEEGVSTPRREDREEGRATTTETELHPATLTYALTRETSSGIEQQKLVRRVEAPEGLRGDHWRVSERVEPAFGAQRGQPRRADTMRLDASSFTLLQHRQHRGPDDRLVVRREGDTFVEAATQWQSEPTRRTHSGRIYGEGMGVEVALATRSLSVGDAFSLPVYVSSMQAVQTLEARVTGTDTVATPADTLSTYVLQLEAPSSAQGVATLYLRERSPHHVVQASARLPIRDGGRRDTLILRRSLTRLERHERPSSAPAVAQDRPSPAGPPTDAPVVTVAEAEGSSSGTASIPSEASSPLVPSPDRLTAPDAYNALLVSFSGQAPRKVERKFSFNFEIRDEEFQLDFAIPVLRVEETDVAQVRALAVGDTIRVPMIEDMQAVAETMFEEQKSIVYTRAVVRSFLKAAGTKGAEKLAEEQGGAGLAWVTKKAGQMASGYAAQADTRGWQTMPGAAYATVARLPAGSHEITFEYLSEAGTVLKRRTHTVEVGGPRDFALAESLYLE